MSWCTTNIGREQWIGGNGNLMAGSPLAVGVGEPGDRFGGEPGLLRDLVFPAVDDPV